MERKYFTVCEYLELLPHFALFTFGVIENTKVIEGNVMTRETSFPDSVSSQQTVAISAEVAEVINCGEMDGTTEYIGIGITSNYLELFGFVREIPGERGIATQTE